MNSNKLPKKKSGIHGMISPLLLLVDDDDDQLLVFKTLLERLECDVITASSATEALGILHDLHVDVVVCDLNMPQMSGQEFMQKVRKLGDLRRLPVIAFSADTAKDPKGVLDCGADYFCAKTRTSELLGQVKQVLGDIDTNTGLLAQVQERFTH